MVLRGAFVCVTREAYAKMSALFRRYGLHHERPPPAGAAGECEDGRADPVRRAAGPRARARMHSSPTSQRHAFLVKVQCRG